MLTREAATMSTRLVATNLANSSTVSEDGTNMGSGSSAIRWELDRARLASIRKLESRKG